MSAPPKRQMPSNTVATKGTGKKGPDTPKTEASSFTVDDIKPFLEKLRQADGLTTLQLPQTVVTCYGTDAVMKTLKSMVDNEVTCLPVLTVGKDGHMHPTDFVDLDDIAYVIADLVQESQSMPAHHASVNIDLKLQDMQVQEAIKLSGRGRSFNQLGESYTTALDLIKAVSVQKMRRCLVVDDDFKIMTIITQGKVARLLLEDADFVKKADKYTIKKLGLGHMLPMCVDQKATGTNALRLMAYERVTSVAAVNDEGHFLGHISPHDLRAMFMSDGFESTKEMYEPVPKLLEKLRTKEQMEVQKSINADSSYTKALKAFVETGLRVLHVTNQHGQATGVLSLTDLLSVLPMSEDQLAEGLTIRYRFMLNNIVNNIHLRFIEV